MRIEVRLPDLGEGATNARVGTWLKQEGDHVTAGQPIVEVETDKTSVEVEAPGSGVLQQILLRTGSEGLAPDTVLAFIAGEQGASAPAPDARADASASPPAPEPASHAPEPQSLLAIVASHSVASLSSGRIATQKATPLARKMAEVAGTDLDRIRPSDGIRVTKADVERAIGRRVEPPAARADDVVERPVAASFNAGATVETAMSPFEDHPLSNLRRVTASRLTAAKQTVPHFYLQADCHIDELMNLRRQWNERNGARVTMTDLIVYCVSRALRKAPLANSAWLDSALRVFANADIAVAVNTAKGLITPVIRKAERKSIAAISAELSTLADRARAGTLKSHEYTGGTFTISNLGMYGIQSITPILNSPQACILGVGSIEQRPIVVRDQVAVGHTMSCTLAADHRAIDGATGAEFMAHLRQMLEDPMSLALDS
jgi:pyruvate dehydrogenase E2 component (dihydrolipoamide acetyltransferase)